MGMGSQVQVLMIIQPDRTHVINKNKGTNHSLLPEWQQTPNHKISNMSGPFFNDELNIRHRFYSLFMIFNKSEQGINKYHKSGPDYIIQYKLTDQDFCPVTENMGLNYNVPVIKRVIFNGRSEHTD